MQRKSLLTSLDTTLAEKDAPPREHAEQKTHLLALLPRILAELLILAIMVRPEESDSCPKKPVVLQLVNLVVFYFLILAEQQVSTLTMRRLHLRDRVECILQKLLVE